MIKQCYVCGHIIKDGEPYYSIGTNSYTCSNEKCFHFYYWDNLAARMAVDKGHNYVIVNQEVYEIGKDYDFLKGFGGRHWTIEFNDGTIIETNSLWDRGKLPDRLLHDFKDNAIFRKD